MILERLHNGLARLRGSQALSVDQELEKCLRRLLKHGFSLEKGVLTSSDGIRMHHTYGVEFVLCEIFLDHDYAFFLDGPCVFIDVGMNFGTTTLYFANQPSVTHVYSFEPFMPTYNEAISNLQLNPRLQPKIATHPFGLGLRDERLETLYEKKFAGGMSTSVNRFDSSDPMFKKENASVERLELRNAFDALLPIVERHAGQKIALKVDTEGAEFDIFTSLDEGGLLRRFDVILMEYHFKSPQELEDRLTRNGFVVFYKGQHKKGERVGVIRAVRAA